MTATITEIEQLVNLDDAPACEWYGECEDPATHQMRVVECGCTTLICQGHTDRLLARMGDRSPCWECDDCRQVAFGGRRGDHVKIRPL